MPICVSKELDKCYHSMCLAEFAATGVNKYLSKNEDMMNFNTNNMLLAASLKFSTG